MQVGLGAFGLGINCFVVEKQSLRKSSHHHHPLAVEWPDTAARPLTADARRTVPWTGCGARDHLDRRGRPEPTVGVESRWANSDTSQTRII